MKKIAKAWFCRFLVLIFLFCAGTATCVSAATDSIQASADTYFALTKEKQTAGKAAQTISAKAPLPYAIEYPVIGNEVIDQKIMETVKQIQTAYEKLYAKEAEEATRNHLRPKEIAALYVSYESYLTEDGIYSVVFHGSYGKADSSLFFTKYKALLFDLNTGETLSWEDVFRPSYKEKASAYAISYFTGQEEYQNRIFGDPAVTLGSESGLFDTFALTDTSVIFYFDKYAILPASCGAPTLSVPRETFSGSYLTDPEEILVPKQPDETETKAEGRTIDPNKPMVALTFDDGPSPAATNRILDTLEKYGVVATFFDVGYRVERYPEVTKRERALGCEIGSHSYDHKDFKTLSAAQIKADHAKTNAVFEKTIGKTPTLFRPPYGNYNETVRLNSPYSLVLWSVDTLDWKSRNAQSILSSISSEGNLDGKVILMHGIYDSTAKAVEQLVPSLLEQGYQLVTVSELIQYHLNETPQKNKVYHYGHFQP